MEKRSRVSEAQWNILIEHLERNPNLAKSRGYNNSARGRAESLHMWQEVATLLNAEGSGASKTAKEWSIYVSNYKSKLKKVVADINRDVTATGGGPPQSESLSELDKRFLALMGAGFGQMAPQEMVHPFPDKRSSTSATDAPAVMVEVEVVAQTEEVVSVEMEEEIPPARTTTSRPAEQISQADLTTSMLHETNEPLLPHQSRQRRQRTRPLAPLDEARRILQQVEMERAAADAANAHALEAVAHSLQPISDVAHNLGRLACVAEQYLEYLINNTR